MEGCLNRRSTNHSSDTSQLVELADKVESLLLDNRSLGLKTSQQCREYLGKHFSVILAHL